MQAREGRGGRNNSEGIKFPVRVGWKESRAIVPFAIQLSRAKMPEAEPVEAFEMLSVFFYPRCGVGSVHGVHCLQVQLGREDGGIRARVKRGRQQEWHEK